MSEKAKVTKLWVTLPNGKSVVRSTTFRDNNGRMVLHIDRLIMPLTSPSRLGAVPPLADKDSPPPANKSRPRSDEDEKIPTAEARIPSL